MTNDMNQHVEHSILLAYDGLTSFTIRAKGAVSPPEESSDVVVVKDARLAACKSRREKGKLL